MCLLLVACAPAPPIIVGNQLNKEKIILIKPGKTTRNELLGLLGIPMAIATNNSTVLVKQPAHWDANSGIAPGLIQKIQSDIFFEFFSDKHKIGPEHRVYYYYHSKSSKQAIIIVLYIKEDAWIEMDKLWVLINEKTGIVEDFYYLPYKEPDSEKTETISE